MKGIMNKLPPIEWVKNNEKFNCFHDGSVFLVALMRGSKKKGYKWDLDVVEFNCDGEGANLVYRNGEMYDAWEWSDFEYFHLLDGDAPEYAPEFDNALS